MSDAWEWSAFEYEPGIFEVWLRTENDYRITRVHAGTGKSPPLDKSMMPCRGAGVTFQRLVSALADRRIE